MKSSLFVTCLTAWLSCAHEHHHHDHRRTKKQVIDDYAHKKNLRGDKEDLVRCSVEDDSSTVEEAMRLSNEIVQKYLTKHGSNRRLQSSVVIEVPTYFHIFTENGQQDVSDEDLQNQLDVMNQAFKNFEFTLLGVARSDGSVWKNLADDGFYVGDLTTLNVKLGAGLAEAGLLGYTNYPNQAVIGEDGVLMDMGTLPGGSVEPYNEGKTLVHEVGHWLGLFHTFANGCSDEGDLVGDTPAEAIPASGCPIGRDTCPNKPGDDPVTNFMDVSSDSCMTGFSEGQELRMLAQYEEYRGEIPDEPASPPPISVCFSGSSTVHLENGSVIPMKRLRVGDRVQVDSKGTFESVYAFGHLESAVIRDYLRISSPTTTDPLEISPDHMIFVVSNKDDNKHKAVPASMVHIGDILQGGHLVTKIERNIPSNGAYAPFTNSGTIVVNQIVASNYVSLTGKVTFMGLDMHWVAHTMVKLLWWTSKGYNQSFGHDKSEVPHADNGIAMWIPYQTVMWVASHEHLIAILLVVATSSMIGAITLLCITHKKLSLRLRTMLFHKMV